MARRVCCVMVTCSLLACGPMARTQAAEARTDARGFVDVWALRDALAPVEALQVHDEPEHCGRELDGVASPSPRQQRAWQACTAAWQKARAHSEAARRQFNADWGPVLLGAIGRGDRVAEVIWRQCATTPVLDRSALESSCADDAARRAIARRRLREIGFVPAIEPDDQPSHANGPPPRTAVQAYVLRRYAAGDLGMSRGGTHHGGNAPRSAEELEEIRDSMLVDTVLLAARRAFTYSSGKGLPGDELATLRLNRRPTAPGVMTWQANTLNSGQPYSGPHDWRAGPITAHLGFERGRQAPVGGPTDARLMRRAQQTLAAIEASIERWLADDPRWGVFLLQRVGHHEWVPQGLASTSARLNPGWAGLWTLKAQFDDLRPVAVRPLHARISADALRSQISFEADPAGGSGPVRCDLRYSGGSSQRPEGASHATTATSTVLGYLPSFTPAIAPGEPGPVAPFAPLNPRQAYRQVLVHCPQGEWLDSRTARFLFLARDTLVEVMRQGGPRTPLVIRHWQRGKESDATWDDAPSPGPEPTAAEVIGWFDSAARQAEATEERLRRGSTADLIALLASARVERLYYDTNSLPEHMRLLIQRPGITGALCNAQRGAEALVRFNLMLLINQRLKHGVTPVAEQPEAAACLRQALADPHAWVRIEAAWGLRFAPAAAEANVAALRPLLNDPEADVRGNAADSLKLLQAGAPTGR
ncbi:MAG: HEAT repeat domain-containing protein [Burkholderiales bacterium]|nr:HEAT repeat domain-containing protein [Burkholderiales bacterium]